ncbi:phospholipid-binding lipoprotein MlaA [Pseudomonas sp. IT-P44]|jgi:phospholipid-binding lipoprotein MlaA|uniref:MlaA family lipoprotein n=1 Tax=unclassified Pseudomonas TaxID=196821 RepID=UPI000270948B|nr:MULTISPECIES: VacJ family lipoprotein [unclassified Pseudomonas]EJM93214.1 surface lipoprotein [Pseudomonas sp. GM67]MBD9548866.1 VacJ family lipoprotein [Pseudomonas sp. PDM01]
MLPFKCAPWLARNTSIAVLAAGLAGCSSQPSSSAEVSCADIAYSVYDPAEPLNRGVFAFNRVVDDYALAPVARGYRHTPDFFQTGVHNFVANFGEPEVFINDLLQGNPMRSVNTLGRFALNTTVGVVGLIDVSGMAGIPRHKADFGQTFGVWGIGDGPIVELPLLGTSNSRDAAGRVLSFVVDPFGDNSDTVDTLSTINTVGDIVDGRAEVLPLTDSLQKLPDYYSALRNVVAEHRAAFVVEGKQGSPKNTQPQCTGAPADGF